MTTAVFFWFLHQSLHPFTEVAPSGPLASSWGQIAPRQSKSLPQAVLSYTETCNVYQRSLQLCLTCMLLKFKAVPTGQYTAATRSGARNASCQCHSNCDIEVSLMTMSERHATWNQALTSPPVPAPAKTSSGAASSISSSAAMTTAENLAAILWEWMRENRSAVLLWRG